MMVVIRYPVVLGILVLMLSSCAKQPSRTQFELTEEQKAERQALLNDALDPDKLKKKVRFDVDEFVGHDVTDYAKIIRLADSVLKTAAYKEYTFGLEGVSKNEEGWGTLVIRVTDGRITQAFVIYPEW